jgi:hypothetical protein
MALYLSASVIPDLHQRNSTRRSFTRSKTAGNQPTFPNPHGFRDLRVHATRLFVHVWRRPLAADVTSRSSPARRWPRAVALHWPSSALPTRPAPALRSCPPAPAAALLLHDLTATLRHHRWSIPVPTTDACTSCAPRLMYVTPSFPLSLSLTRYSRAISIPVTTFRGVHVRMRLGYSKNSHPSPTASLPSTCTIAIHPHATSTQSI